MRIASLSTSLAPMAPSHECESTCVGLTLPYWWFARATRRIGSPGSSGIYTCHATAEPPYNVGTLMVTAVRERCALLWN